MKNLKIHLYRQGIQTQNQKEKSYIMKKRVPMMQHT